jgi:multiple sugar transport system permease protein
MGSQRRALRWRHYEGYLFILPWLIGLVLFRAGPMVVSLALSFTRWDLMRPPRFVGLENYENILFDDPLFWKSLQNTAIYVAGRVPLVLALALLVALLLNQAIPWQSFFRTAYYLPVVTPEVATALLWAWMFEPNFGVINSLLKVFGVAGPPWLASTEWALPAVIIVSTWSIGSIMVIYLAGLQGVPQHLYEAAELDGANALQKVRHVTVPYLTPVIFFNLVVGVVGSFQIFTKIRVMTNGGPANATMVYVLYLYNQAFQWLKMGYGAALAWILFLLLFALTVIMFRRQRWVYYEGARR